MVLDHSDSPVRLDKWLWAARFFKTRGLASKAIHGGKIHANGHRAKASKIVHIGDVLNISNESGEFEIVVQQLSEQRGSASVACLLYQETETSLARRQQQKELRRLNAIPIADEKPNKKDRRLIIQLKTQIY